MQLNKISSKIKLNSISYYPLSVKQELVLYKSTINISPSPLLEKRNVHYSCHSLWQRTGALQLDHSVRRMPNETRGRARSRKLCLISVEVTNR